MQGLIQKIMNLTKEEINNGKNDTITGKGNKAFSGRNDYCKIAVAIFGIFA